MNDLEKSEGVLEDLERWRRNRKAKQLDCRSLEDAISLVRNYRNLLRGGGVVKCPRGHEYPVDSIDPCDIPF